MFLEDKEGGVSRMVEILGGEELNMGGGGGGVTFLGGSSSSSKMFFLSFSFPFFVVSGFLANNVLKMA